MRTKQDTLQIVNRLKEEYPLAECTLDYDSAWQLLVSVRLAAQCTDARVNIVTEELFAKYPTLCLLYTSLDITAREQLESLVLEYAPTLLFTEHDAVFRRRIATQCVQL